jgi:putrescine---pyruvate transaminase
MSFMPYAPECAFLANDKERRRPSGRGNPTIPASQLETLLAHDREHLLHPFTDHRALHEHGARIVARAEGIYLIAGDGRRWIDGMSGLWCTILGYSQPEIVAAAAAQMSDLPYCSSFFGATHPAAIELAHTIASLTPPGLDHVFFSNSGSEANDTAIRAVRRYWQLRGEPQRRVIISRRNAYHGSTYMGASLGGFDCMHAQGGLPLPEIVHIREPYHYRDGGDETPEQFGLTAARALEAAILQIGARNVAAFIAEPIQGAGGVVIPPATYWPEIERIARRYQVPIIADEVVCGFGRTGEWFGCQHLGFVPDVMTLSKGLAAGYAPIAATVLSQEIAAVLRAFDGEFEHGFTSSGHPVSCAVALKTIELLARHRIIQSVREDLGPHFNRRLRTLAVHGHVDDIRSTGLMAAIELAAPRSVGPNNPARGGLGAIFREACAAQGLIVRVEGDTVMLAPPLICTRAELDSIVERLSRALALLPQLVV